MEERFLNFSVFQTERSKSMALESKHCVVGVSRTAMVLQDSGQHILDA